jgi:DNA polymerase-3 subunit gamma/tau
MSHLALYRKYRPETFDEVIGQEAIVHSLKSAIVQDKLSHAYLFSGSRGTGKTSLARIFARYIGTSPNDIYEIDAASHNGVDEIRELRDGVSTLPFDSKYKVYILDEVHMLSKAAFNALLKTLEEPPKHVIFILATTELHKVIDTVKSRCQVFEFKKPSLEELISFVQDGAKKENRTITDEAADQVARFADGAYRDAWGILERILQSTDKKDIGCSEIVDVIGKTHADQVTSFISALNKKDLNVAFEILHTTSKDGDVELLVKDSLERFRLVLLKRFAPAFAVTLLAEYNNAIVQSIDAWAGEKNIINAALVVEFLKLLDQVKESSIPTIPVELALMRMLGTE